MMGNKDALDRDDTIEFVMSCWDDEAGALDDLCLGVVINLSNSQARLGRIQTTMHICTRR